MKATILTVDDEEMIRDLLVTALSREGYDCFQAGSADEARDVLLNNRVELALLDIMMPGTSGVDLLKEIKKISADTVVLMVTAISDMETAMRCIHLGADDYILKPFDIERVLLTIKNSLEKQRLLIENREYQANLEKRFWNRRDKSARPWRNSTSPTTTRSQRSCVLWMPAKRKPAPTRNES